MGAEGTVQGGDVREAAEDLGVLGQALPVDNRRELVRAPSAPGGKDRMHLRVGERRLEIVRPFADTGASPAVHRQHVRPEAGPQAKALEPPTGSVPDRRRDGGQGQGRGDDADSAAGPEPRGN